MPPYSPEQSIPQRVEEMARLHATRHALLSDAKSLTYADLNAAANRIARRLLELDPQPQTRVALLIRHDVDLFPAVLAVLKAGKIVVVLNPTEPAARHLEILRHAQPAAILHDIPNLAVAMHLAETIGVPHVNTADRQLQSLPADNLALIIPPTDLAFLIYTSGSTGKPKAVMQPHRNILHNVLRFTLSMKLTPEDRILSLASLSGGQGVATTWQAFLNGGTLVPFPAMEIGVNGLADLINRHQISMYISAASLFRHFMQTLTPEQTFPTVRIVRLGSESAPAEAISAFRRHFSEHALLYQTLSASETGNVTQHAMNHATPLQDGPLPVGIPVHEIEVVLLNDSQERVAPGEVGEIHIRSRYLSPGYWRDEPLSAERFSAEPDGTRRFRTGDLGRLVGDTLHYLGRKDHQVKVRGFRVELSEVEAVLAKLPCVQEAIVVARPSAEAGTAQLAAYLTLRAGQKATPEGLRSTLQEILPRYMIPSAWVLLDHFPRNPHGKIDRAALPPPPSDDRPIAPPQTATETVLAAIWESVFHFPVGRDHNFFDLGGDSLSAAVIAARVNAQLHVAVDFRFFVDHPLLADQALQIERGLATPSTLSEIQPVPRGGAIPLSFEQEAVLKHCARSHDGFVVTISHRISGPLRVELLERCLNMLMQRHEALHIIFSTVDGRTTQVVLPHAPSTLPLTDLESDPDPNARVADFLRREADRPLDLAQPLVRFSLLRLSATEHKLIRVHHHINSDAWSWQLFFQQLAELYESDAPEQPSPATPPLTYADYSLWQRQNFDPASLKYKEIIAWWKSQLEGCTPLKLPFERGRLHAKWLSFTRRRARHDALIWWGLAPEISSGLADCSRTLGVTPFSIRLGLLLALLSQTTGQRDLLMAIQSANRTRVETQSIFGFFANRIPLRFRLDPSTTLGDWLKSVQATVAQGQTWALLPIDRLLGELKALSMPSPRLRAVFALTYHHEVQRFGGLRFSWQDRLFENRPGQFTLAFNQFRESNHNRASFNPFKHDAAGVRTFLDQFTRYLAAAPKNLTTPLNRIT